MKTAPFLPSTSSHSEQHMLGFCVTGVWSNVRRHDLVVVAET